ncbi:MAG: glycosyltransferase family 8 protein [Candidatus Margulisbacteria bacterium]|nr:glycosyltransferase family 8 protein [Candidatus Margulisiibacteriota bacterium]
MSKVPVVFVTDEHYVIPTCVAITSLLANRAPKTFYNVFIIGIKLSADSIAKLDSIAAKNFRLKIIAMPENKYAEYKSIWPGFHVTTVAMHKFDIVNILKNYAQVIYLDSDIIVQTDLSGLHAVNLKDNYAAAVKDMKGTLVNRYARKWGLSGYFNSGVQVLNLKKMREDKIFAKMMHNLKISRPFLTFMDQDVFNVSFQRKVIFLSPLYNYMINNIRFSLRRQARFFNLTKNKMRAIIKSPAIIHYTNSRKPWAHYFAPRVRVWLQYYKLSPYAGLPLKRRLFTQKDLLLIPRILCRLGLKYK